MSSRFSNGGRNTAPPYLTPYATSPRLALNCSGPAPPSERLTKHSLALYLSMYASILDASSPRAAPGQSLPKSIFVLVAPTMRVSVNRPLERGLSSRHAERHLRKTRHEWQSDSTALRLALSCLFGPTAQSRLPGGPKNARVKEARSTMRKAASHRRLPHVTRMRFLITPVISAV